MIGRTVAATTLAASLVFSASAQAPQHPAVQCEITVVETAQGRLIRPVAQAGRAIGGAYQLSVETVGDGGRSQVSQGGDFSLRAGQRHVLGTVSVGGASGAQVTALLVLTWRGGRTQCVQHL